ncbi:diaminopimelate decarboxylase [Paramicrobacterium agarici]|uniref:Diaminopimelate decarboxylase n=1 Tax=Paramicrobacterium agarici TaxID=630514 RepID=A0A2A9DW53_9MICO|nr:diaminopimelate decarboxylase [Microbacterium agarici]PFG30918.1 diaminopimelate decarboxylase [Microbacterium agarici]TQO23984.1 diaminopimelate decarboxylase [Microbacterium agarici]
MTHNPLAPSWLTEPDDANALAPGLWPRTAERESSGELQIGGVPATEIARQFGTPVYVIDEREARERADDVRGALQDAFEKIGSHTHVYYAGKALLTSVVARWMVDAGCRIDVCSGGELAVALAAGVEPGDIGFHGNNKSLSEIDRAVGSGVGTIIIDSIQEIGRVAEAAARHGVRQRVRLRVNSGVHAHTHEFLATAHEDQKFGLSLEDAPDAVQRIRHAESLEFVGLHCHIGSQIFGAGGFAESAARLLSVHKELLRDGPVPELNLGGGFGIAYTSADAPTPISDLADAIAAIVRDECGKLQIPVPDMAFEPGRAIIGTAGITLYEAGTTKPVTVETAEGPHTRLYVSVDGGMSDNARTALYDADYSVRIASRRSASTPALVRIAGKHCESGDIVVSDDYLPSDVKPGDLLAVPATGAYCWSLASNYNYLGRPPIVAVRDGHARVIVRGETEADLMARDAGLDGR